jgi:hypothetical protein
VEELDEKLMTDTGAISSKPRGSASEREKQVKEKSGEKKMPVVASKAPQQASSFGPSGWIRRPEVAGALVALGCLVWAVLVRFDPRSLF